MYMYKMKIDIDAWMCEPSRTSRNEGDETNLFWFLICLIFLRRSVRAPQYP